MGLLFFGHSVDGLNYSKIPVC